ncbi:MAG: sigma-70 family RNA polymerase sigma factor [Clostridiaceae bacterium]|nr:sigma-70 family RNA polymerase sigma factor [Clostridiaceae bacterium]
MIKLKDEDLIIKIRNKDQEAMEVLLKRYKPMVVAKSRRLFLQGGDQEDLIQEGMIGLYQAIEKYDLEKQVPFKSYAGLVVESRLYDAVRTAARKKHGPLNESLSLDYPYQSEDQDSEYSLIDFLQDEEFPNPENRLLNQENVQQLQEFVKHNLSEYENQVAVLYLAGKTYNEIADILSVSYRSVDGALQRIRRKIMQFREENLKDN